jgi:general secretion pathway protein G
VSRHETGMTYVELVATVAIMLVVAALILPTAKATRRRAKEIELQAALRQMRNAIDEFHARCDPQIPVPDGRKVGKNTGSGCGEPTYPEKLEDLVKGVPIIGDVTNNNKMKFLRDVPPDPMNGYKQEWDFLCQRDRPDATTWCGTDIFDVRSKSKVIGSDGRHYNEW